MTYVIVINMDYVNHPPDEMTVLWTAIKRRMLEAGFICDGRTFVIHGLEQEACQMARGVIEALASELGHHHQHIYRYLKDFYGYDLTCTTNLMLPPTGGIRVEEDMTPG